MPVPSSLADISTTAASNSPAGADAVGTSLDDYLRTIQAIIKRENSKGTDITASTTIDVPADGSYFVVTGNTTITGISDDWNGRLVVLKFSGTPQLTHSSGFILPGSANITVAAGDCLSAVNESTGVWRVVEYQPAAGNLKPADIGVTVQGYDADTLKSDTTKTLTAGYAATPYNAGTKSSGTFTPDEANGNQQYCTNGGTFTLAPPTNPTSIILEVLNNGSAGAVTTSGFTKVTGSFTTTNGHKFVCNIVKTQSYSLLQIQALQ